MLFIGTLVQNINRLSRKVLVRTLSVAHMVWRDLSNVSKLHLSNLVLWCILQQSIVRKDVLWKLSIARTCWAVDTGTEEHMVWRDLSNVSKLLWGNNPCNTPACRVAKCHGYGGYIRVKKLVGVKSLGEYIVLQNQVLFWVNLSN